MTITKAQRAAIMRAEPTFDGEERITFCHGRTAKALRAKGLATGNVPYLYLTDTGKAVLHGEKA